MSREENVSIASVKKGAGDGEIVNAVKDAALAVTDFSWLKAGDRVFIKVAGNSPNPYPATTSPLAVRGMAELLKEKDAGEVLVGDKSGVQFVLDLGKRKRGSTRKVMRKNGLLAAIESSGATPHFFEEAGYEAFFADHTATPGNWKGPVMLPNIIREADHVVLLPRVSRHVLAGATLGLKAAVGYLRDDARLELHRDAATFYEKCAEINGATELRKKLRLTLSVATKIQTTFGPDFGYQSEPDPGLVFASASLLAHDMAALAWLYYGRDRFTPRFRLHWFIDPYKKIPGLLNKFFTIFVWGPRAFLATPVYSTVKASRVSDDPVLSRMAVIEGGFPKLNLLETNPLSEDVKKYILEKTGS